MALERMETLPGMSVRREIEGRLADARAEARAGAFEEAIAFLRASGHPGAAVALEAAAFGHSAVAAAPASEPPAPILTPSDAREAGFTGSSCTHCGSLQMVRNGTCEKCTSCGETTGCS